MRDETSGKFVGGPRMAFIIAESGIGKSRLVQALYQQLTDDAQWDPPEVNYWPDAFQAPGEQIRVNPDPTGHKPNGPPRFLWLGMRWQPTETRNIEERSCRIPEARDALRAHVAIANRHRTTWQHLQSETTRSLRSEGIGESIGQAADLVLPFGGLLLKVIRGAVNFGSDRASGERSLANEQAQQVSDAADEFVAELREVFGGIGSAGRVLPTVLWLDDAQWIDPITLRFLYVVWAEATQKKWPLFIVVTHWERQWRELLKSDTHAQRLTSFVGKDGVSQNVLKLGGKSDMDCLVKSRFPSLTPAQRELLVSKADGNFLTMIENLAELSRTSDAFIDGDASKKLSANGETFIKEWESDRQKRVEQLFSKLAEEVKTLLGWGSACGVRFLTDVVLDYSKVAGRYVNTAANTLETCIDPFAILGTPTPSMREFRDLAFHVVARRHFDRWGRSHSQQLQDVLRNHLIEWINHSFDADGEILRRNDDDESWKAPANVAIFLDPEERRDLLGMAVNALPMPSVPDWTDPAHVAALRSRILMSWTDAIENLHNRVREQGRALENLHWDGVPTEVVAMCVREVTASVWETAGALKGALSLHRSLLAHARALADVLGTPESRRDVTVSLDNVAGIEQARGDLGGALLKYTESLEIRRALADELGTVYEFNQVAWTLCLTARIRLQRDASGDRERSLAVIHDAHQLAVALSDEAQLDTNILDTAATVWEVTAECLLALGRADEAEVARAKAHAIRSRIKGL